MAQDNRRPAWDVTDVPLDTDRSPAHEDSVKAQDWDKCVSDSRETNGPMLREEHSGRTEQANTNHVVFCRKAMRTTRSKGGAKGGAINLPG